mgnify:CR=1 FL=1
MNKIVKRLETEFSKIPDLVIKKINLSIFKTMYLIYLETVSSSNKVNDYILKNIILKKDEINKNNISSYIAAPNTLEIKNVDECEFYLTNGFSLVIIQDKIYAIETRADISRAVSNSEVESSINGPKDAFTEKKRNFSQETEKQLRARLMRFHDYLYDIGIYDANLISGEIINTYILSLARFSTTYVSETLREIKRLFIFAYQNKYVELNCQTKF